MRWLDALLRIIRLQVIRNHRGPDDVDPKHYLRDFTPKKVWVRCSDDDVIGPVEAKFFRNGKIIVKPISVWIEVYPNGTGSKYIKEWWPDQVIN